LSTLKSRLNEILPAIESEKFIHSKGLGNEMACYLFTYEPEAELLVREHLANVVQPRLEKKGRKFLAINLFEEMISLLQSRSKGKNDVLKRLFDLHLKRGDEALFKSLEGALEQKRFAEHIMSKVDLSEVDFFIFYGVGGVWPIIRMSEFLNAMHPKLGTTPAVLFYPGKWDQKEITPFNLSKSNSYYRGFRLVE
jgi:hypothetical protein